MCRDSFLNHDNEASTSYASSLWLYAIYISRRIRTKLCSMCKISLLLFNLVWRLKVCDNFFTFITSLENSSKCIGELLWYSIWALIYYDIWLSFCLFVCCCCCCCCCFRWKGDGSTQPNEDLKGKESAETEMEVDIEVMVSDDTSRSENGEDWATHHLTYWLLW